MRTRLIAGLMLVAPVLAGCTVPPWSDPFDRPGTWQPTGANEANLRAMAQNPADLERGQGATTAQGATAFRPIDRFVRGQRAALPQVSSAGGAGSGGTGSGVAAGQTGGL
ncbi:hypothetical protein [Falsiroseomonas sp. HW251]|uniref:hypothetical protein n=1 Tax=Falsiroseomonas sp. HW251 TaxID=3390998 RepID=UPI003D312DDA